jgi:iron complex transport system permease protein
MSQIKTFKWLWLLAALTTVFFLDISLGSVAIPLSETLKILTGQATENQSWENIILLFRLPRVMTGLLVGSGLAVSGLLMQTLFRNPLAGPFVLGISSGASLGVAILVLAGTTFALGFLTNTISIVLAASIGSAVVLALVLAVSGKIKDSATLLIVGLMFGSISGALVGVLQYFSNAEQLQSYMIWTFGSLGGVSWRELPVFAGVVLPGLLLALGLFKPLNALIMGENYAQSLGVNIKQTRFLVLLATSLLAGTITAFAGPIAFVGIAVPHLTRVLFTSSDHKILLPAVALSGAILMIICDIIAQLPGSAQVLPINAVTSIIGAPVVIWIIVRKRNVGRSFGA